MKRFILIFFLILVSVSLFSDGLSNYLKSFIGKEVEVQWILGSGYSDASGILLEVSDYGIIIEGKRKLTFINYEHLITVEMKY